MALFGFRIRSSQRDGETDSARFRRLLTLLDELGTDIGKERAGLQNRYESASINAAYAQQALEDGSLGEDTSSRIDDLTDAIKRFAERMAMLEDETILIDALREQVIAFARTKGIKNTDLPVTGRSNE